MPNSKNLEDRVRAIEKRNKLVSLDKSWETSWTRRLSIAVLTYFVVLVYLFFIHNDNPWINAIVPPIGFLLSTLAIGWLKNIWQDRQR